jgi:hypothetical protein
MIFDLCGLWRTASQAPPKFRPTAAHLHFSSSSSTSARSATGTGTRAAIKKRHKLPD